jgi:GNAT superfamily N-acetyltransferase
VTDITVGGFLADPVMRWVMPDDATRAEIMQLAFFGLARSYLAEHCLLQIAGDGCITMWRAPTYVATHPAESSDEPADSPFPPEVGERFRILGELMAIAHPQERHWYLNVISTLPARQGQGLGAQALAPVLARADAEGVPAYLESSNPRNMTLYRRHGFVELEHTIDLPDGPSLFPMWRTPR